jgi:hypothetical protein
MPTTALRKSSLANLPRIMIAALVRGTVPDWFASQSFLSLLCSEEPASHRIGRRPPGVSPAP